MHEGIFYLCLGQGLEQFVAFRVSPHQHVAQHIVLPQRIPTDRAARRRHIQIHKMSDTPSHLHFHGIQFEHTFFKHQHVRLYLSSSGYSRKFSKNLKPIPELK